MPNKTTVRDREIDSATDVRKAAVTAARKYEPPQIEKREKLAEVTAAAAGSLRS